MKANHATPGLPPLVRVARALARAVDGLRFGPPVTHVYSPLLYARRPHEAYLARYGDGSKDVLLVGMNPGPFGMVQTGVPFGDVSMVRDWLGIEEPVARPTREHPRRPIEGFACARGEVSGQRLWGWARALFGTPEAFFARFFVWNYCPLAFLEHSGRNRTPDRLPVGERGPLFAACDEALRRAVAHLRPRWVVGVGRFPEARARAALHGTTPAIGRILHPSPASPIANRGWARRAESELRSMGIALDVE